jgi:hypothetical protein
VTRVQDPIVLVIGHQANAVQGAFRGAADIRFAMQEERLYRIAPRRAGIASTCAH